MEAVRTSALTASYASQWKLNTLDEILDEYQRVMNIILEKIHLKDDLPPTFIDEQDISNINTWFTKRMLQNISKHALSIIHSTRKAQKFQRFQRYQKTYSYFSKRGRQTNFLNKRYSDLNLKPCRPLPVYKAPVVKLDSRFVEIELAKTSKKFDIWFYIQSTGKQCFYIPSKKHEHYHKYDKWKRLKSVQLIRRNGQWFVDPIFQKKLGPQSDLQTKEKGLDQGMNVLFALSDGSLIGKGFMKLIEKLKKKKHGSKGYHQCKAEMISYIAKRVKEIDLAETALLAIENLDGINKNTIKRKVYYEQRQRLNKWQRGAIKKYIGNRCELNRVRIHNVVPCGTSVTCPVCHHTDEKNRSSTAFCCINCGFKSHADLVGSINVLERSCAERNVAFSYSNIVPHARKAMCKKAEIPLS